MGATTTSSANRAAPSFEDTNLAFAELIRDHEIAKGIRFTPEELHQVEERLASFCWHCIKNSCLLLDLVATVSLKDNGITYPLDSRALHDIADALVAVMTGCRHRRSMSWTVDHLNCVIRECAEQCDVPASTVDLPQAEALHVLCAVVGSASLTAAVMMHLGRILWFCFEGLASPFWLVRNAAHQLYDLRVLFLDKLDGSNVNNHDLYFVLDFLSRLKPLAVGQQRHLFSTTLQLLQDEDPQVRSKAAGALPLPSAEPQSLPVQPNVAANNLFKKLVLALEGDAPDLVKFLWCELCRSGPSALSEFQQLVNPT
ncbi:hypothetical protein HPB49_018451 [Dermacentor silvarum]|uniref:Uncharacterized protein n=1 Tax=Dermacentor silvarum TaxID=543639 RepID=A0ACB8CGI2_DERSI|nr:hypothetical protein HPB49_018451 [Dermacentor silvarum]